MTLLVRLSREELDWLRHAAKLQHVSAVEYVKEAINARLRKEGVDAVLFRVKSDA